MKNCVNHNPFFPHQQHEMFNFKKKFNSIFILSIGLTLILSDLTFGVTNIQLTL
jgi:hypothetical protein